MRSRKELADAIRILSMDAVDKAKSGHPGAPMGMADMAEALWRGVLRHNPADPHWANRDRFVLSNGHASMLLYSVLHLTGYDLSMDDIKNFRQLGSRTPGHPEKGVTPGVETTTGPLGQGFATAVGMAVAEKLLAAEFNRDGFPIVDHHTYVFLGDGCLMEGLSQEACSLAGTLGLGKLIVMYDDNGISIDGDVHQWFGDDTPARFEACGWHVISGVDGHDAAMLDAALVLARKETERPTLICCKTTIGYGSPKKGGTASSHGSPMGADENAAVRAALGWKDEPFVMPQDIKDAWDARERGAALEGEWKALFAAYAKAYPDLAAEFERRMGGTLPADWESVSSSAIARFDADKPKVATRIANRDVLNAIAPHLPELFQRLVDGCAALVQPEPRTVLTHVFSSVPDSCYPHADKQKSASPARGVQTCALKNRLNARINPPGRTPEQYHSMIQKDGMTRVYIAITLLLLLLTVSQVCARSAQFHGCKGTNL